MKWNIQINKQMSSNLDDRVYEIAADLFSLLSAPTRLRIVCALMEDEKNVTELIACVAVSLPNISQPNMSQHLGTLYRGGVLARRRTGAQVFYRIDHEQVRSLCRTLMALDEHAPTPERARRCASRLI